MLFGIDRRLVDGTLAVTVAALTLVFAIRYPQHPPDGISWRPFDAMGVAFSVTCTLPLAVRDRFPWPTLLVTGGALALYTLADYPAGTSLWGPLLACYTVTSRASQRSAVRAALFLAVLWFANGLEAGVGPLLAVGQAVIGPGVVWHYGRSIRETRESNIRLAALTVQLEREQAARARHAVVEERLRIARELHDVLAHHVSVISVQAGLARYVLASDPPTAATALDTIAETSSETLQAMRGLLGMLRLDAGREGFDAGSDEGIGQTRESPSEGRAEPYAPSPGLDRLPELVDRMRSTGTPIELAVVGAPLRLPPDQDLSVYRVVQEALTNVLKHASGARTTVELRYEAAHLTGRIANDGTGRELPGPAGRQGGGHGLVGMRERVHLYGGSLHTGAREQGGFEVRFTLPVSTPPLPVPEERGGP